MLKVTVQPTETITVDEAADFMRAEFSDQEESVIEGFITAARQWCEQYLGRSIGVQTLELRSAGFPDRRMPIILRSPFVDIDSVIYTDPDGTDVTMDEADYLVSDAEPATIRPVGVWPATIEKDDSVVVTYRAGYSVGSPILSETLPKTIKTAMLMMVADMYANREAQVEKQLVANPTVERLISTYRLNLGQ